MSRRSRRLQKRSIAKKQHPSEERTQHAVEHKHHHASHSNEADHHKQRSGSRNIYEVHYRKLIIIPIIMLIASFFVIGLQVMSTGNVMEFGVSITGGISITAIDVGDFIPSDVEASLSSAYPQADFTVRRLVSADAIGVNVEASGVGSQELLEALEGEFGPIGEYSLEETGSTLGERFFRQSLIALVFAFVFMGIVVFFSFKTLVPSAAVILSAIFDLVVTMAIVNIIGMRISTAGLAAFLMLIGYSVDTDILLTSKIIRGKKEAIMVNIYDAMGTGMLMTFTTIAALTVGIIFSNSEVLTQIMTIVLIGLLVDLISTWIQNAGILRIYMERKRG